MYLLLPPSEGKTAGGRGRPLRERPDADADAGPLAAARRQVRTAVLELVAGDRATAARALLLPAGVVDDALAANARILDARTTPALRRYAGVVYDGLGYAALTPAEQRVANRSVLVFSGLFGVVRGDEPVPPYRVPAKADLPGIGVAATFWRPVLTPVLAESLRRGLVVDLRSSDYAAMWRPGTGPDVVSVRVLSALPGGGRGIVSYSSKFAKGRLAAELVRRAAAGAVARDVRDVADAWAACGGVDAVVSGRQLELHT